MLLQKTELLKSKIYPTFIFESTINCLNTGYILKREKYKWPSKYNNLEFGLFVSRAHMSPMGLNLEPVKDLKRQTFTLLLQQTL